MDQTNPLAEVTHKRDCQLWSWWSFKRRAGFEVRDVITHYGRLCPIETPEGPNIGLISSLLVTQVNNLGLLRLIVSRRRVVQLKKEPIYLTAEGEDNMTIAQANAPVSNGHFENERVKARYEETSTEPVILIDGCRSKPNCINCSIIDSFPRA